MIGRLPLLICLALLVAAPAYSGSVPSSADAREWNFKVYLDNSEIGYHNFMLVDEGVTQKLVSEAEFKVKFLFITAYEYEHYNEETWQGDCVAEISSTTDANGQQFAVEGRQSGDGFAVSGAQGLVEVPGCVKTFAYWNPEILEEPKLMNSQTGEILPVTVEPVSTEWLTVRGETTEARRYKLIAKNMELDIWYSNDNRWLALESTVKGGRKLRYELT